ncbi:hypothetical protein CYMTET_28490 [Cymbomonas tetramitiformis]|uniref:Major facilitator superfamily (MFS) profile domain-containing protein n=1 Tax=Cymbomonas tetramitiformis TaxID=36881 RepID=A0AAE0KVW2_9CHLO|nr:hypothetical protein CYMTET_28490 [Cymbomonas tetramitiformis]
MQLIGTVLPGLSVLALTYTTDPSVAVVLLASTLCFQAFSVGGNIAYIQDVAPARAGFLLGLTNATGVAVGIFANILTGYIVDSTGSFQLVFLLTGIIYLVAGAVFCTMLQGKMLFDRAS